MPATDSGAHDSTPRVLEVVEDAADKVVDVAHEVGENAAETAGAFAEVTTHAAEAAETHRVVSTGARVGFALDVPAGWWR